MTPPLPEAVIAGACFLLFVFFLVKGMCEAARQGDEVDQQIFEAECELRRHRTRERKAARR